MDHYLRENDIETLCYHGEMPTDLRSASYREFADSEGIPPVLIATDLAARGLDFNCDVSHVIMFDFPLNAIEFIHRSGRTARAGKSGTAISLLDKRDLVLAENIKTALRTGGSLESLSSSKEVPRRTSDVA